MSPETASMLALDLACFVVSAMFLWEEFSPWSGRARDVARFARLGHVVRRRWEAATDWDLRADGIIRLLHEAERAKLEEANRLGTFRRHGRGGEYWLPQGHPLDARIALMRGPHP